MHTRIWHYIALKTGVHFTASLFGHSQIQFINLIPLLELFARGDNEKDDKTMSRMWVEYYWVLYLTVSNKLWINTCLILESSLRTDTAMEIYLTARDVSCCSLCASWSNFKFLHFLRCFYMFFTILKTNSDYLPKRNYEIDLYTG
jgi:hypothetical protein